MGTVNTGAPDTVWNDPSTLADAAAAYGLGWVGPLQAMNAPHVVTLATLCAGPPPPVPDFSVEDIAAGYVALAGVPTSATFGSLTTKLNTLADRHIYDLNCTMDDGTAPPSPPPPPPQPVGLPDPPPQGLPAQHEESDRLLHAKLLTWLDWMRREIPTRTSFFQESQSVTGAGTIFFDSVEPLGDDQYPVYCCGVQVEVTASPGFKGHSAGSPQLVYDLGSFACGYGTFAQSPIKIMWRKQVYYGWDKRVMSLTYNLATGVTVRFTPMYPDQAVPVVE